jgi:hypothetical protein
MIREHDQGSFTVFTTAKAPINYKKTALWMTSELDALIWHPDDDWRALVRARVNVLVTGSTRTLGGFVELCRDELRQPFAFASPDTLLPSHSSPTLVITDVPLFDETAQHMLAAWMCDPTTRTPR